MYRRLVGLPEFDRLLNIDTLNEFLRKHIMADIFLISKQKDVTAVQVESNQTNEERSRNLMKRLGNERMRYGEYYLQSSLKCNR